MTTRRLRQEALRKREPTKSNLIYHLDNAKERIVKLEEALRKIASCQSYHKDDVVAIAREALKEE